MAHDDIPYTMGADASNDVYYDIKKAGMWRTTQRTAGVSTSDVVLRIIKDYDLYVERNLGRGYTPSDLGISQTKALRIKFRRAVATSDDMFKSKMDFYWKVLFISLIIYFATQMCLPYMEMK